MIVLLQTTGEFGGPRKIQLRGGQVATIGRTELAEYSFPADSAMQPQHFEIDCRRGGCILRVVAGSKVLCNGKTIESAKLVTGDAVRAGSTLFDVTVEGALPAPETECATSDGVIDMAAPVAIGLSELCQHLGLDDAISETADSYQDCEEMISTLIQQKQYHPALRLRAHTLSNQQAIGWSCLCMKQIQPPLHLNDNEAAALGAAEAWVREPSDDARRQAEQAASATGPAGGAGLIAWATFCSGGSIGHPDMAPAEPDPRICGTTVAGALMVVGYSNPAGGEQRLIEFLKLGKEISTGKVPLPE